MPYNIRNNCREYLLSVFLGGMIGKEPLKVQNGHAIEVPELSSNIEVANERLFIQTNYANNTADVKSLLTASSDTDVIVHSIYYQVILGRNIQL